MSYKNLIHRIKKNEGYSDKPYKDQLGNYTIGYGHLIKKNENKFFTKRFDKKYFENIFILDFNRALIDYNTILYNRSHQNQEKELLIEMIFQLGIKGVLKFKKTLFYLNRKQKYMASLEMLDSLWYKQTPHRVINLIKNYLKN